MWKDSLIVGTLVILFGAAPLLAQQAPQSDAQASPPAAAEAPTRSSPQAREEPRQPDSQTEWLVGLPIWSSDEQHVGRVSAVELDADGTVNLLEAEIGGFLGIGQSTVWITSDNFTKDGDRIVLSMTADEVGALPAAGK